MALVPPENPASSDGSSSSDDDPDVCVPKNRLLNSTQEDSDVSSEPRSIPSSMEKYNISDTSDDDLGNLNNHTEKLIKNRQIADIENVPLTPIISRLFQDTPRSPHAPLPVINNLSCLIPANTISRTANQIKTYG